jgi:hypothetical protein
MGPGLKTIHTAPKAMAQTITREKINFFIAALPDSSSP